jgi:hypothetical protein
MSIPVASAVIKGHKTAKKVRRQRANKKMEEALSGAKEALGRVPESSGRVSPNKSTHGESMAGHKQSKSITSGEELVKRAQAQQGKKKYYGK